MEAVASTELPDDTDDDDNDEDEPKPLDELESKEDDWKSVADDVDGNPWNSKVWAVDDGADNPIGCDNGTGADTPPSVCALYLIKYTSGLLGC